MKQTLYYVYPKRSIEGATRISTNNDQRNWIHIMFGTLAEARNWLKEYKYETKVNIKKVLVVDHPPIKKKPLKPKSYAQTTKT